jgi:hypothetical protein
MDGREQINNHNISENIARLFEDELEPGKYSLAEDNLDITIEIIDIPESVQQIIIHTVDDDERITTVIKVQSPVSKIGLPIVSASSTRTREDSKDLIYTYWNSDIPETDASGRFRPNSMNLADLTRIIEYVKNPNKQVISEDL